MVRAAIDNLSNEVKQRQLRESANLYAEVYENDEEQKNGQIQLCLNGRYEKIDKRYGH